MTNTIRALVVLFAVSLCACESAADKQTRETKAAQAAISTESAKAHEAAALPLTDKWDEPHLVQRLVRAGLAPQAAKDEKGQAFWKVPVRAYHVGPNMLYVYLYADSTARLAVTSTLDTLTAMPRGQTSPYEGRHVLIKQNNLAAVMVGGTDAQQERVSLALEAGLPMPAKP
jgi:hypothetical protein